MKWHRQKLGDCLPPWLDNQTARTLFLLIWIFLCIPAAFVAAGWMLIWAIL